MSNMRKSTIYALLALFVWTMAVPATAQKKQQRSMKNLDPEATVEAVKQVIRKHQGLGGANFIETEIYPQFKKNPEVLTNIAHAFDFQANDTTNAFIYIERALAVDPKFVPAYVEKGSILSGWAKTQEDTLAAYGWFDKAIAMNPKSPLGYQAYSKALAKQHDYDGAAKKLEEILQHDPNYNVYVEIGNLYGAAEGLDYANKAIEAYAKADMAHMTSNQIAGYVTLLQAAGKAGQLGAYKRSDSLLTLALTKYPTDAKLNRLMMQNSVAIQKYDQAIAAADVLFNKSDSAEISLDDFMSYAKAYEGLKNYNAAIDQYRKCLDYEIVRKNYKSDDAFENAKFREERQKNTAWQAIAKAYDASGYTDKAIEEQKKFIEHRREQGKLDAPELQQLARFYESQAEISMGEEQRNMYKKYIETYIELAEVSPQNAALGYFNAFNYARYKLDPENKEWLYVPYAEKVMELIPFPFAEDAGQRDKIMLETVVARLGYDYFQNDQYKLSGKYWRMIAQINPDNAMYLRSYENKIIRKKLGL